MVAPTLVSGAETSLRVRLGILSPVGAGRAFGEDAGDRKGDWPSNEVAKSVEVSRRDNWDGPDVTRLRGRSSVTCVGSSRLVSGVLRTLVPVLDLFIR